MTQAVKNMNTMANKSVTKKINKKRLTKQEKIAKLQDTIEQAVSEIKDSGAMKTSATHANVVAFFTILKSEKALNKPLGAKAKSLVCQGGPKDYAAPESSKARKLFDHGNMTLVKLKKLSLVEINKEVDKVRVLERVENKVDDAVSSGFIKPENREESIKRLLKQSKEDKVLQKETTKTKKAYEHLLTCNNLTVEQRKGLKTAFG